MIRPRKLHRHCKFAFGFIMHMFHHIAIILPADLRTYKIPNFYFQKGWKIPLFDDHNVKIAKEDVLLPLFT
jgi:hypothetical protein